jgi:hypothetical protein
MTAMRSFAVSMRSVCSFGPILKAHRQRNLVWHYPSAFVVCSPLFGAMVVVEDLRRGCVNFCWRVGNGIGPRWECGLREGCVASNGCLVIAGVFVAAVDGSCRAISAGEVRRAFCGTANRSACSKVELRGQRTIGWK